MSLRKVSVSCSLIIFGKMAAFNVLIRAWGEEVDSLSKMDKTSMLCSPISMLEAKMER